MLGLRLGHVRALVAQCCKWIGLRMIQSREKKYIYVMHILIRLNRLNWTFELDRITFPLHWIHFSRLQWLEGEETHVATVYMVEYYNWRQFIHREILYEGMGWICCWWMHVYLLLIIVGITRRIGTCIPPFVLTQHRCLHSTLGIYCSAVMRTSSMTHYHDKKLFFENQQTSTSTIDLIVNAIKLS